MNKVGRGVGWCWLALILSACSLQVQIQSDPPPRPTPPVAPGAVATVLVPAPPPPPDGRRQQFHGDGAVDSSYLVTLPAGRLVVRSHSTTPGLLTIEILDPTERTVGAISHINAQGEHSVEVLIPASGMYTVQVDYMGTGAWQVELEQPAAP